MKRFMLLLFTLCCFRPGNAQSFFTVPPVNDAMQFEKGIARAAWLFTSSTEAKPQNVRILLYGQSISEQAWWKEVRDFVINKFPSARIDFINKAIGGFSAERLKLMVENDVVSFYPDLLLFDDYGGEIDY